MCLFLVGCGTSAPDATEPEDPSELRTEVVQVTTLTTVQASSGAFLSPGAQQERPDYLARAEPEAMPGPTAGLDRSKVDVALLFRESAVALPELEAEMNAMGAHQWSPIDHYFPALQPTPDGARWPIQLVASREVQAAGISSEWSGWQTFGGQGVRSPGPATEVAPRAAVATLDFEARGGSSPLVLSTDGAELTVSNRSREGIERALLVYSHPGGVGVTAVSKLGPGESRITFLGPKEHPPGVLLDLARAELRDFFAASVGNELGAAIADAKSIPFLETPGLRLISVLSGTQAPMVVRFSPAVGAYQHVVVSHSEIFKLEEEERVLSVLADDSLAAPEAIAELGRFSAGKLEYAIDNGAPALSARAASLLEQLR